MHESWSMFRISDFFNRDCVMPRGLSVVIKIQLMEIPSKNSAQQSIYRPSTDPYFDTCCFRMIGGLNTFSTSTNLAFNCTRTTMQKYSNTKAYYEAAIRKWWPWEYMSVLLCAHYQFNPNSWFLLNLYNAILIWKLLLLPFGYPTPIWAAIITCSI